MFSVYLDGGLLYAPQAGREVTSPKLTLEAGKAGSFSCLIPPSNPLYGNVNRLKSIVEVYKDARLIWRGRVYTDALNFYRQQQITCEGELAYLNDSIMPPYSYNGSVSGYISQLLAQHNSQVEAAKQIQLGEVTVTDPNNYIVRANSDYTATWSELSAKCVDLLGGYFFVRRVDDVNYLDYLADSAAESTQAIELSTNLLDLTKSYNSADVATVLIPLGARDQDSGERLTVADANDGSIMLEDADAISRWGRIVKTQTWDDVTQAQNLLTKGKAALAELVLSDLTIEIKAADLSQRDSSLDDFGLFEYITVTSPQHDLSDRFLLIKQDLQLDNPASNSLTLSKSIKTSSDSKVSADAVIRSIKSNYVSGAELQAVRSEVQTVSSLIDQQADQIRTEVKDTYATREGLDTLTQTVSSQFLQTATDFELQFSNVTELVTQLAGTTDAQFEEIKSYIRASDGKLTLGRSDSPVTLELSNDRLSIMSQGAEVAYFADRQLYQTNGVILNRLQIGNHVIERYGDQFTIFRPL